MTIFVMDVCREKQFLTKINIKFLPNVLIPEIEFKNSIE